MKRDHIFQNDPNLNRIMFRNFLPKFLHYGICSIEYYNSIKKKKIILNINTSEQRSKLALQTYTPSSHKRSFAYNTFTYLEQPNLPEGDLAYERVILCLLELLDGDEAAGLPVPALEDDAVATLAEPAEPLVTLHRLARRPRPAPTVGFTWIYLSRSINDFFFYDLYRLRRCAMVRKKLVKEIAYLKINPSVTVRTFIP